MLFYLQTRPNPRYNVNRADFDIMHEALYTIDWLDIMEPMDTQEAWQFFKIVFQNIIDKCNTLRGWIKGHCWAIYLKLPCNQGNI